MATNIPIQPCFNSNRARRFLTFHSYGQRHVLALLGFLGFFMVYAMRVNLSVAIVAMVKSDRHRNTIRLPANDSCPAPVVEKKSNAEELTGEFDWDERTQGIILGCFFYGYLLTNFIGGRMAEKFGGRLVFGLGVVLTSALTIVSPLAAHVSTNSFILIRILEGMTEGVTFPAVNSLLASWIPPNERARAVTLIFGGSLFGTVVTLPISGWLCQTHWGWPSVFYFFGVLGLAWGWLWFQLAHDTPDQHPTISLEEKLHIKHSIGGHKKSQALPVPWRAIFTSPPALSLFVVHVGNNWGFYCLLTELPTYLKNIQHFDIKSNGIVSAIPYLLMWTFSLFISSFMDKMLMNKVLTLGQIRKLSMAIGHYIPMLALIWMSSVGCNPYLAVAIITVTIGMSGAVYSGYMCSFQDLAPNFAGTLTGISNTLATIPGFLAPIVTGLIINNQQTLSRWRQVFLLAAGVYAIACTVFQIFMSSDIQPWNEPSQSDKKKQPLVGELKIV
ncbi:putative inorganic phosphate cotransporter isoform X2 [Oratosquilla oratoria]|uniref:putative inorganic phosphate cotransporter isoform X2 n=1 Tax=Oratosquilla oratoria TaxID=337810 RepID=UPI003F759432